MKKILTTISFLCFALPAFNSAYAVVEVKNIKLLSAQEDRASIAIVLSEEMKNTPEVSVRDGLLQVALPQVSVWPKIEKKVTLAGSEVTLMAYQFDKSLTRFRALIPYSLVGLENDISLQFKANTIVVDFPVVKKVTENFRAPAVVGKAEDVQVVVANNKKAADYDEGYLEKLLKEKKVVAAEPAAAEDKVSVSLSATEKVQHQGGSNMDMLAMVGKFSGFLLVVIGLFFGLVGLFKRGVLKKGKLGFLNNTEVVTVLNTTYVGPKKTLLLVKVHRQVFLLSNDERGIAFLSEVHDTTGLLKNGEEQVSGSNFDTTLVVAEHEEKEMKLKEVAPAPVVEEVVVKKTHEEALNQFLESAPVRDQVKFSDQIKNKVKNLKALQ